MDLLFSSIQLGKGTGMEAVAGDETMGPRDMESSIFSDSLRYENFDVVPTFQIFS